MATHSIVNLPLPGTKGAPTKFKGKHSEVEPFLYLYERLCSKHTIVSDKDKIESPVHYYSQTVKETSEGLSSYEKKNWSDFIKDLRKYYEAERDKKCFKISDLNYYTKKSSKRKVKDLANWMKYT